MFGFLLPESFKGQGKVDGATGAYLVMHEVFQWLTSPPRNRHLELSRQNSTSRVLTVNLFSSKSDISIAVTVERDTVSVHDQNRRQEGSGRRDVD